MANLGLTLENRLAAKPAYNKTTSLEHIYQDASTFTSDFGNYHNNYSISFAQTRTYGSDQAKVSIKDRASTQTRASIESSSYVLSTSPLSTSLHGDKLFVIPAPCKDSEDYILMRPKENVYGPLLVNSDFYHAHEPRLGNLETAVANIVLIKEEMETYRADGELSHVVEFAYQLGLRTDMVKMPDYYGALSSDAIAFTVPGINLGQVGLSSDTLVIGAGIDFENAVGRQAQAYGVSREYTLKDLITEEVLHHTQPDWIEQLAKNKDYVELMEAHVKSLKSLYFFKRAQQESDAAKKEQYMQLSKVNFNWYADLVFSHAMLFGVDLSKKEIIRLIETESPGDLVSILSECTTRMPNRCKEGGYNHPQKKHAAAMVKKTYEAISNSGQRYIKESNVESDENEGEPDADCNNDPDNDGSPDADGEGSEGSGDSE